MDIRDIRLANLKMLIRDHAGGDAGKFVEIAGLESHTALLHVTGPRRTRNLGSHRARQIEQNLKLAMGWMDRDHSTEASDMTPGNEERIELALKYYELIEKLAPKAREALKLLIEQLLVEHKATNPRRKKPDSPKR